MGGGLLSPHVVAHTWDLCSSNAVRLEPLFDDLLSRSLYQTKDFPQQRSVRFSVEVGSASDFEASPLQLRGVVKNAMVEAFTAHGVAAELDADSPDIVFVARRAACRKMRRTVVGIDIGGGARHRRGARAAMGPAPLRETMAAQLIMLSRWDARIRAAGRSDGRRRHDSNRGCRSGCGCGDSKAGWIFCSATSRV